MFRKFIERIVKAENRQDAMENVFYGADGIDMAFQHDKISWKDHELLLDLIEKLAD